MFFLRHGRLCPPETALEEGFYRKNIVRQSSLARDQDSRTNWPCKIDNPDAFSHLVQSDQWENITRTVTGKEFLNSSVSSFLSSEAYYQSYTRSFLFRLWGRHPHPVCSTHHQTGTLTSHVYSKHHVKLKKIQPRHPEEKPIFALWKE